MDEAPAFFDMIPAKSICKTGSRECIVRTSGREKKHVTVVPSVTTDGTMVPPMLIFKEKTDKAIKNLAFPNNLLSKRKRSRGWMKD